MKRITLMFCLLSSIGEMPAHAQADAPIQAAMLAEQKANDAFMHIQIIQEIMVLSQTYQASVQYINQWKQLNSGRGIMANVGQQLQAAQNQETKQITNQWMSATNARGTAPGTLLYQTIDQAVSANMKYTGDEMANVAANRQTGVNVAQNANGLSPKDAANATAQAQGMQIQMLTQLHEDNLRLLQILSLQLSAQARPPEGQQDMIQNMNQSVQKHFQNASLVTGSNQ